MAEAEKKACLTGESMRVAAVTGSRAEYGVLHPVLTAIRTQPRFRLLLVVSGMHLSHEFGYTFRDVAKDGFQIDAEVDMLLSGDTPASMAKSVGIGVMGMTQAWQELKPDIVLVIGDRVEPLAATIAAAYMNIPVAHIHGGDTSRGGLDESARHAITKFAHIHLAATEASAKRIINMGEDAWRVHVVGSPALDVILRQRLPSPKELVSKYCLDLSGPLLMVVQHPVTTQVEQAPQQMLATLEGLAELGYPVVIIYPNSDAGGRAMIEVIRQTEGKYAWTKVLKSLPRTDYLGLMKVASVLVGNSSSGIIEAPSFGLPVVNIGIRQQGRERGANVIDVGHDRAEIKAAVQKALTDSAFLYQVKKCLNPYGDGKSSGRIADVLANLDIGPRLLQKKLTY